MSHSALTLLDGHWVALWSRKPFLYNCSYNIFASQVIAYGQLCKGGFSKLSKIWTKSPGRCSCRRRRDRAQRSWRSCRGSSCSRTWLWCKRWSSFAHHRCNCILEIKCILSDNRSLSGLHSFWLAAFYWCHCCHNYNISKPSSIRGEFFTRCSLFQSEIYLSFFCPWQVQKVQRFNIVSHFRPDFCVREKW